MEISVSDRKICSSGYGCASPILKRLSGALASQLLSGGPGLEKQQPRVREIVLVDHSGAVIWLKYERAASV